MTIIVFVKDEDHGNLIYMKEKDLIDEEIFFLHHPKNQNDKYNDLGCLFHILIKRKETIGELEEWLKILNKNYPTITLDMLLKINKEEWKLISFEDLNILSKSGILSSSYAIDTY